MASPRRSTVPLHPVIDVIGRWNHCMAFLAIAFAWSWSCWLLTASLGARFTVAAGVMTALGSFGPGIAAVTVIGWVGGGRGLRAWFGRCLQWRVGVRPFVLAVFLPLAVLAPAALVHAALGGRPGTSPVAGHLPMAAANVALILLLGGPTGEEFGWRGYAWPALRAWHGWRASSLILGAVWGLWHLPLFFIAGTLQSRLPLLPFLVSAVALSVVFGWLSTRSRGSVLPALVLHTAVNWWAWAIPGLLVNGNHRQMVLALALLMLLAISLLAWPARRVAPERRAPRRAQTHRPRTCNGASWKLPQHPGTGPMKTDSQLQQDVSAELEWEPSVQAARIGVEVKDGVVTLAGEVDSYAQKWNAERAAQRVSGVKAITTELKVQLASPSTRTDGDIAESVENVLEWTSSLPAGAIQVMVEAGWVTLSGDVDWQYQRQAATDSVRNLWGVTGVSNQIGITLAPTATAVKFDIEAALKRTSIADARHILVAVHGSDVTLSGTVHSWDERATATHSAWGTPGVRNVIDVMTLAY